VKQSPPNILRRQSNTDLKQTEKMRKFKKLIFLTFLLWLLYKAYFVFFSGPKKEIAFENEPKKITLENNGLEFPEITRTDNVGDFLQEKNIQLGEYDQIIPEKREKIYPSMRIEIRRAIKMKVEADGKKMEIHTLEKTIKRALSENSILFGRLDKTTPDSSEPPQNNITVVVTRINVEEVAKEEPIDFKIIAKKDDKLGWREKKVETPGETGIKEVKYKITYKNGKEISRLVLEKKVTREPVPQVEVQGTLVKVGKAQKGQGTWYAYKGGMFAASLTIPKGGYARVTNTGNGKSVIVQINDSGPYGKGRIIDLDKVAFEKIASLGAGVIGVKVEEVLN
jgi:uncharacterized protein YabE (DUF348 family)